MTPKNKIDRFKGDYSFLSNFYMQEFHVYCPFTHNTIMVKSIEHIYQASKANMYGDFVAILSATTPAKAKRMGRKCKMRKNWETDKILVMAEMVTRKFIQNRDLGIKLVQTGDAELIEGNWWGVRKGEGQNILGKLLMETRELVAKIDNDIIY